MKENMALRKDEKKALKGKRGLKKETLRSLNESDLKRIAGGRDTKDTTPSGTLCQYGNHNEKMVIDNS